jgi:outer membrane protein OmpA-like peptidoglycan-associated protein
MRKIVLVYLMLPLTGCMTYDPYTDEKKVSGSTKGAIIGGLAGAALGNQVKGSRKTRDQAMVAGALLGMAAGGAIGNTLDKRDAELRQKLRGTGVRVVKGEGGQIVLEMPGAITFPRGSALVGAEFREVLGSIAQVVKHYKGTEVEVAGYADSKGRMEANQALSQSRANAVASVLRAYGVSSNRIVAVGYGEGGSSDYDRRVEITLNTPEG